MSNKDDDQNDKIVSKILSMINDKSAGFYFEYDNREKVELLEAVLFAPAPLIVLEHIYKFLNESYDLIIEDKKLTEEEKKDLFFFKQNFPLFELYVNYLIKKYRQKIGVLEENGD